MKILSSPIVLLVIILAAGLSANFVSATGKIDINSALSEDLIKIVHIGEVRAKELISLRPFSSLDDLVRIKGIGSSRVEDIKKQGLAWVRELQPEIPKPKEGPRETEPAEVESSKKELAAVAEQIPQKSAFPLLIGVALAIFSGIIILILKKKLKIV